MRFLGILCLVLAVLAYGAVERTAPASTISTQAPIKAGLAQAVDSYGSRRAAHPGHVAAHRALPEGDTSSAFCKILCAVAVSQPALVAPNSLNDRPQHGDRTAAAGDAEADEVTPGLQPPPPR